MFNLFAAIICLLAMWISKDDVNLLVFNGFLAIVNTILFIGNRI